MSVPAVRLVVLAALATGLLSVGNAGAAVDTAQGPTAQNRLEGEILAGLNSMRRARGLAPLRLSRSLSTAADAHTRSMGRHGFFAHEARDGRSVMERVRPYYARPGRWAVGENLAWSSDSLAAAEALSMWMDSPGHRRNMLTASWRDVGLAAVFVPAAPGVYKGLDVVIVTMTLGTRS